MQDKLLQKKYSYSQQQKKLERQLQKVYKIPKITQYSSIKQQIKQQSQSQNHYQSQSQQIQLSNFQSQFKDQYDPFKSPPDLEFAYRHRLANYVGIDIDDYINRNDKNNQVNNKMFYEQWQDQSQNQDEQIVNGNKSPQRKVFAIGHNHNYNNNNYNHNHKKNKRKDKFQTCPCCDNIIQKVPISLHCQDQQLLFLGVGYPLIFKLFRYFSMIILFVFVISGSAYYFLVTLRCHKKCVTFMGVPILNLDHKSSQIGSQTNNPQSSTVIQIANVFTTIIILIVVLYIKSQIIDDISQLQKKKICPSQYSIMLQNLPQNYTLSQLSAWIVSVFDQTPVKINQAYDVTQLQNAYNKKQNLVIDLNKSKIKKKQLQIQSQKDKYINTNSQSFKDKINKINQQIIYYQKQLLKVNQILSYYKQLSIQCKTIGTAFITFQKAQIVQRIIIKYQTSFIKSLLRSMISVIRHQDLQFKNKNVLVFQAPAPSEIIWQNLDFSYFNRLIVEVIFIVTMIVLIFGAFRFQFYFVRYAYELRTQGSTSGQAIIIFQAMIMSLIVVLLNYLFRIVILYFAKWKKHYSYSRMQSSFCSYYSLFYIFNSCFMIYIVHGKSTVIQDTDELLLYDIHLIMLANAFSQPLSKIFQPLMWGRIFFRFYIKQLGDQKNPYTQEYVNKLWQGYQISNGDNYQYVTRVLFITLWFAHTAPLGVFFSLTGLLVEYWVQKILLLRVYKKPQNISKQLTQTILKSFELLPLVYICGILQFRYKIGNSANIFNFFYEFLSYGITSIFIIITLLGYLLFVKQKKVYISQIPYSQIQIQFDTNYQTQNPMTKFQGQINYLYGLLKNKQINLKQKDNRQISQYLQMSRKSSAMFISKLHQIKKMKRKAKKNLSLRRSRKSSDNKSYQMRQLKNSQKNFKQNQNNQQKKDKSFKQQMKESSKSLK